MELSVEKLDFYFSGKVPAVMGFDVEKAVAKPGIFSSKCANIPVEISMVSGDEGNDCVLHSYIYHNPSYILSYNTWITKINRETLKTAPPFKFVQNQLKKILLTHNPLLVGCNIRNDLKCLDIEYENTFDLHDFFYEYSCIAFMI